MRALTFTVLLAITAVSGYAADFKFVPPSPDYKTIPAGEYTADPHHSSVTFRIAHMGLSNFTGRFDNVKAHLVFNPADPAKVDMEGRVAVANVDTGNPELDSTLKGTMFFDAEHFPDIKFVARSLDIIAPDSGKLVADVTVHGVTKPILFTVVFHGHGKNYEGAEAMGFSAHGQLKRSDFGMKGFPGALGDEVEIWLESEFNKKS